jgi:hypothetical protein
VAAAGLALAVTVVTIVPAQAQYGYLRAAPYGYGPYGGYGAYGSFGGAYGFVPFGYEYYLPSDQHRFYDRASTDFNS